MQEQPRLGGFATGYLIFDLIMCLIRLCLVAFTVLVLAMPEQVNLPDETRATAAPEVLTGVGIGIFGLLGNALILAKKPIGVTLGWLALAFTLLSIGVGVWAAALQIQAAGAGAQAAAAANPEAFRVAMMIGAGAVLLVRLVLLGLYGMVLVQAKNALAPPDEMSSYAR